MNKFSSLSSICPECNVSCCNCLFRQNCLNNLNETTVEECNTLLNDDLVESYQTNSFRQGIASNNSPPTPKKSDYAGL